MVRQKAEELRQAHNQQGDHAQQDDGQQRGRQQNQETDQGRQHEEQDGLQTQEAFSAYKHRLRATPGRYWWRSAGSDDLAGRCYFYHRPQGAIISPSNSTGLY